MQSPASTHMLPFFLFVVADLGDAAFLAHHQS
jgi:hypothetical protein